MVNRVLCLKSFVPLVIAAQVVIGGMVASPTWAQDSSMTAAFTQASRGFFNTRIENAPSARMLQWFHASWRLLVWPAGSAIKGCFLNEGNTNRATMVRAGEVWSAAGNIRFDFGQPPNYRSCATGDGSEIRVAFAPASFSNSHIGTRILAIAEPTPTLTISTEGFGRARDTPFDTYVHELGHTLGLPHEHQHPGSPCSQEIDLEQLCRRAGEAASVQQERQIAETAALFNLQRVRIGDPNPGRFPPYDRSSIMHYEFPETALKGGRQSACRHPGRNGLSEGDKQRIALLYPADPRQQIAMLRAEANALARALADAGVSINIAQEIKFLIDTRLARKFPNERIEMDLTGLNFRSPSSETALIEQRLTSPAFHVPAACPLTSKIP